MVAGIGATLRGRPHEGNHLLALDTDPGLPGDAARKRIGTMAHPLNRPRFDPVAGRVVEGCADLCAVAPHTDRERLVLDGKAVAGMSVPLVDDRQEHTVEVKVH